AAARGIHPARGVEGAHGGHSRQKGDPARAGARVITAAREAIVKVLIVGLDCAEPSLVFDRWPDQLPTLRWLMESGSYGELISSIPAMTVPAWASMMSGKDPGQLGFYDFRNRADRSYEYLTLATGSAVKVDRAWDIASRAGKHVVTVSVPQTYPVRPVNG